MREAIAYINAEPVPAEDQARFDYANLGTNDTIVFNLPTGQSTITLSAGEMTISERVTIDAQSQGITIDANLQSRIFNVDNTSATMKGLRMIRGLSDEDGGAILNDYGILSLIDCVFENNSVAGAFAPDGGAVAAYLGGQSVVPGSSSFPRLVIERGKFELNEAGFGGHGGAVAVYETGGDSQTGSGAPIDVVIRDSVFARNMSGGNGGGLFVSRGNDSRLTSDGLPDSYVNAGVDMLVERTKFELNVASLDGGGMFFADASLGQNVTTAGEALIVDCPFRNNFAGASGGGLFVGASYDDGTLGVLTISGCEFSDNEAQGGTYVGISEMADVGVLRASQPEFGGATQDDGVAGGGGIVIYNLSEAGDSNVRLVNSTISQNKARNGGGAIFRGQVNVEHSTIMKNQIVEYDERTGYLNGGGGVLLADVQGTGHPDRVPLAEFHHSIVVGNSNTAITAAGGSANIGFVYQVVAPGLDGWAEKIVLYLDDRIVPYPGPVFLTDVVFPTSWPPTDWMAYTNLTQEAVDAFPSIYFIDDFVFDYSILGDRSGRLHPLGAVDEAPGLYIDFDAETFTVISDLSSIADTDLSFNGGMTRTHALVSGSPAINAGDPALNDPTDLPDLPYDQRGEPYQRIRGGRIDIGAYESSGVDTLRVVNVEMDGSLSNDPIRSFDEYDGSGRQLLTVPIANVDTIKVHFNHPVASGSISQNSLTLTKISSSATLLATGYSLDTSGLFATWYFLSTDGLTRNHFLLTLPDSVTAVGGSPLDGEWVNPTSIFSTASQLFPSGDGEAGGDFQFLFTIMPGDAVTKINATFAEMAANANIVNQTDMNIVLLNFSKSPMLWAQGNIHIVPGANSQRTDGDDLNWVLAAFNKNMQVALLANFDGNKVVDGGDLLIWQENLGATGATHAMGDANFDGVIDESDLLIWQRNFFG